jgi:hypothetical protein
MQTITQENPAPKPPHGRRKMPIRPVAASWKAKSRSRQHFRQSRTTTKPSLKMFMNNAG